MPWRQDASPLKGGIIYSFSHVCRGWESHEPKNENAQNSFTLLGTNISPFKGILKMIFPFPRHELTFLFSLLAARSRCLRYLRILSLFFSCS